MTNILKSHCKINLGLKILGKDKNNYHKIESLVLKLNLHDEINISPNKTSENKITFCQTKDIINTKDNTISKALDLITSLAKGQNITIPKYNIDVVKQVPSLSGLAGGSANGTTVYKYLFEKYLAKKLQFNQNSLAKIGMDCVLFTQNSQLCLLSELGDIVEHEESFLTPEELVKLKLFLSTIEVFLFIPKSYRKQSTGEMYKALNLSTDTLLISPNYKEKIKEVLLKSKDASEFLAMLNKLVLQNDFFDTVKKQSIDIASLSQFCSINKIAHGLSGSGSTIFILGQQGYYNIADFADCSSDFTIIKTTPMLY
jgi:4-diphosphocytidyl-2-C-methyl-D-erythritol kinase